MAVPKYRVKCRPPDRPGRAPELRVQDGSRPRPTAGSLPPGIQDHDRNRCLLRQALPIVALLEHSLRVDRAFFVVDEAGTVDVFDSVDRAAGSMEVYDLDCYVIFDDSGRRYKPTADGYRVRLRATDEVDYGDLVRRLTIYAQRRGQRFDTSDPGFPKKFAQSEAKWQWEHRSPKRPRWLDRRLHGNRPPDL